MRLGLAKANRLLLRQRGETYANPTKGFLHRLVELVDYPLTAKGSLQAEETARWFSCPLEATAHRTCAVRELGAHLKNSSALVLRLVSWAGRSGLSGEAAFVSDTPQAGEPEEPRA